jgi:hypothetical protein
VNAENAASVIDVIAKRNDMLVSFVNDELSVGYSLNSINYLWGNRFQAKIGDT